ncbi:hypothetical protein [Nocardia flavorosea]|uniref:Uncharacterized protein n=1 Tax=Nocardia flavorosea TaxID=53429 RepID=A0A846YRM9_9NOCA|nr:hypothetical protein [Nocardia flavorosea]NKY59992.1 hypothetical protein [Nocardia flavorosea]
MHENNLFSHVPAEPEAYTSSAVANQPVFSNATTENRAAGDATPEDGAERP